MTSNRPYLIRAIYQWIYEDNNLTPHILVDATYDGVRVPQKHVRDGQIVLNIAPAAIHDLHLGNDWIEFSARFNGVACLVLVPVGAVLAIYARENGQGMAFNTEEVSDHHSAPPTPPAPTPVPSTETEDAPLPPRPPRGKPTLKIVK